MGRGGSRDFGRELVAEKGEGNRVVELGWEQSGKRGRRSGREKEEVSENGTTHLLFMLF